MAALTETERVKVRRGIEKWANDNGVPVSWVKAAVNDSAQAVEDAIQAIKADVANDIDAASQPHGVTFTAAQKKVIAAWVLRLNYVRDTIG